MDVNDILALVKAGFSKDEITAFTAENGENQTSGDDARQPSAATEDQSSAEASGEQPQPQPQPQPLQTNASWEAVMESIKTLTQAVQAQNRQAAQMGNDEGPDAYDTLRALSGIKTTKK